ncbi:isoleucine--tRNA ligase [Candidatus Synechococcus spongiarum]|uniref:Isoleucine--tRNA ligase n=1 Tax=Candidatus Synechococcus spongiarum TaxID=431041 RepID=A0A165AF59_9SYNE|nr:isoleucine--tRNA ligase [Candidatus Synechococcus spongiarum]SAY38587.1 Isoleucyl-tRNA synthetase (EC 6.1.1.5) [Candidatus Synechococcus spongiarum]
MKSDSSRSTINLPKTGFGMRANAVEREPQLQQFWAEHKVYERLSRSNTGKPFVLHDGPPYANGALHMGHALNKVLKDIINKYKLLQGCKVRFVPGWDCHGLPIELKVLQGLTPEQRQRLTPVKLRKKAAAYARKQMEGQRQGFRRWGIWGDWDNPYLTLQKEYEAAQIEVFGRMVLAGHIYRGLKPVHWSPSSRTALAEAELEYPEGHTSSSVYGAFPVQTVPEALAPLLDDGAAAPQRQGLHLAIWTTTPWTLPANVAVAVNPRMDYAVVTTAAGRRLVVACGRREALSQVLEQPLQVLRTLPGTALEGIGYIHPLLERQGRVVLGGDMVTADSGTGLVHIAPGHGAEDFAVARRYNLPTLCPVDGAGTFTAEAGPFAGLNVLEDANPAIIAALKDRGALLASMPYTHRYPYDWRTKKPTIFRATEQWFASLDGFRDAALAAIGQVTWLPVSGRNRIEAMVQERGDWCISRQRVWGVPIPVFYARNGDEVLLNEDTLTHVQKLFATHGSDVWWTMDEAELLPPAYAPEAERWRKGTDTMDVWFDSGSSWAAVAAGREELTYPAHLYLEGSDQHRGWFQSSLLTSVAVHGHAPYRCVLTHGFTLDEQGRKMSKSLGNVVDPTVVITGGRNKKTEPAYGADVLRLWVSSVDYSSDVPIGAVILRQLADVYRKVRNTCRYMLGNVHDFQPERDGVPLEKLAWLDRWLLHRTGEVLQEATKAFEEYEFYRFFQILQNFCVVDLSNFYLDIVKDRLYISAPNDESRRQCQTVLAVVVEQLAGMMAPVLCHMAEDIWQNLPYSVRETSVFERGWPQAPAQWRHDRLAVVVRQLRRLRTGVNRQLQASQAAGSVGASLEAQVRLDIQDSALQGAMAWLQDHDANVEDLVKDWLLVSQLRLGGDPLPQPLAESREDGLHVQVAKAEGWKCSRCWHYTTDQGETLEDDSRICDRCAAVLRRSAMAV